MWRPPDGDGVAARHSFWVMFLQINLVNLGCIKKKKRRISCSVKLHFHWHKSLANEHAVQLADPLLLNKMVRTLILSLRNNRVMLP